DGVATPTALDSDRCGADLESVVVGRALDSQCSRREGKGVTLWVLAAVHRGGPSVHLVGVEVDRNAANTAKARIREGVAIALGHEGVPLEPAVEDIGADWRTDDRLHCPQYEVASRGRCESGRT